MKGKTYIWIAVAILGVGGYYAYKEFKKPNKLSKSESVDVIIENGGHSNRDFISTFETGFLIAWANAIIKGEKTFVYNGKSYNSKGGTAIK